MQFVRIAIIYLIVALIAGGIAYLGNFMGKKIGRRKMTVFGLRPKHTSNLITALTGSLIAVTTLTLFAVASSEVRQLLKGVQESRDELRRLQAELYQVQKTLSESRIVFGVGETILQGTIEPHFGVSENLVKVRNALDAANTKSIRKNNDLARRSGEALVAADAQLVECSEEEVELFARHMAEADKVVGVQIVAGQNCLYKDKIPVHLRPVSVSRVFAKGEVVASAQIQPSDLREWHAFLDKVTESALRRGMIEVDGSLGYGLKPEDLERLTEELKALRGPGSAVAVAEMDLYQTSSLAVKLVVRPLHQGWAKHVELASRHKSRRR